MERGRLLIVDDDPGIRDSLSRALGFERYEVSVAADGDQALGMIQPCRYDAVVLDVMMPGSDGLDVARSMRRNGDATPILMLTARHAVTDRVAGLDAGADDHLVKPFSLDELLARLRALLRRSALDVYIGYLRRKIEADGATRLIHTVRGVGSW